MSTSIPKVPRLPKGRGFRGPDFYGCFNTGSAPCIRRSRFTGKYVVGAEMNTDMALSDSRILSNRRKFEVAGRTVWVFKTRAPAVRKFNELCKARIAENERVRAEHKRDLQAARKSDLAAALRLGDY